MHIQHVALTVRNLQKSIDFYTKHFGFRETNRFTKSGWSGEAAVLELNNTHLELFGFKDYQETKIHDTNLKRIGLNHFAIEVENVQKMHQKLKAAGVDIDEPQKGTTITAFCFLRDPDGITIELCQQ